MQIPIKSEALDTSLFPPQYRWELERMKRASDRLLIAIEPYFAPKSSAQNRYFHAMLRLIAAETGNSVGAVKEEVKRRATEMGYPTVEEGGDAIPKSSAEASESEMAILIDALFLTASENGILLPDSRSDTETEKEP